MTTPDERTLARSFFKSKAIIASGQTFQCLFWDVMKAKYGAEFSIVAPQGRKGDGGNDGYLHNVGHYFQVYAPLDPKEKKAIAADKAVGDFEKIKANWPGLKKYSFVYNDKYGGVPKEAELALQALRAANPDIAISQYCCRELEADFLGLPSSEWDGILGGPVPSHAKVTALDYSVLREVITYILETAIDDIEVRMDLPPELDEKIKLNGLSLVNAAIIRRGALYAGHIDKYFAKNTSFALVELRNHVVAAYEAAREAVPHEKSLEVTNKVFVVFRRALFPRGATEGMANAVDAVIGYFFEACDVFSEFPRGDEGASSK